MATITFEKRLSAVEAELAEIKRRLSGDAVPAPRGNSDKSDNSRVALQGQTSGENNFAAIRAQNSEARNDAPYDQADAGLPPHKTAGALDAALATIWRDTPDEAWDKLPSDFGDNLDHYLHGTPKQ